MTKPSLSPQDALFTHRNITRTIRTYHHDHWSTKTCWLTHNMQPKEDRLQQ